MITQLPTMHQLGLSDNVPIKDVKIKIDDATHRKVKIAAIQMGVTIGELYQQIVTDWIEAQEQKKQDERDSRDTRHDDN